MAGKILQADELPVMLSGPHQPSGDGEIKASPPVDVMGVETHVVGNRHDIGRIRPMTAGASNL